MDINIQGVLKDIKNDNALNGIVEAITNSIHSIEEAKIENGKIEIFIDRELTIDKEGEIPPVTNITVRDNGIGFDDENRTSFNTFKSSKKAEQGGKGFGRFIYLNQFASVSIKSTFKDGELYKTRSFKMGTEDEIIKNEKIENSVEKATGTEIIFTGVKDKTLNKRLIKLSSKILEKMLLFFTRDDYSCPEIIIYDRSSSGPSYTINNLLEDKDFNEIQPFGTKQIAIPSKDGDKYFAVHLFKVWYPENQQSKIYLTAQNLLVTDENLKKYVNEFEEGFSGILNKSVDNIEHRYIIKAYVTGEYLDTNVETERIEFNFNDANLFNSLGREDIERAVAQLIKKEFVDEFTKQRERKNDKISVVLKKKPYLNKYRDKLDIAALNINISELDIENLLEIESTKSRNSLAKQIEDVLDKNPSLEKINEITNTLVSEVSDQNKEDLARYLINRKAVLDVLSAALKVVDGKVSKEEIVHNIIFPIKATSDLISMDSQNIWILDERLNFTEIISSDKPLSKEEKSRPDLIAAHHQLAFRAGDTKESPITIVEFKRPLRKDFLGKSKEDDPIEQVIKYRNQIVDSKISTLESRPINVNESTPFYGFVIIDFDADIRQWLRREKDFKPMPDEEGYFAYLAGINMYIEVLSWDKVLSDAKKRNEIFFTKLGIS